MSLVGDTVKRLREEAGLSQQELADATGILRQTIRDIELGVSSGRRVLQKLADFFHVDVYQLDPSYTSQSADPRIPTGA